MALERDRVDHDPLTAHIARLVDERVTAALERALGLGSGGLLTTSEAARLANVTPTTIRRWLDAGRLTARRAGRVLRVDRAELQAFLDAGPVPRRPTLTPEELAHRDAARLAEERRRRGR
jgi:excisionase family DNA binding protein